MSVTQQSNFNIREFEIELISKILSLHQLIEGDVSCVVWDASIVLAKYLEELCKHRSNHLHGINIIELGAGVGCVGLAAACLGANVLLTDLPEALPLLQLNIERNSHVLRGTAQAAALAWGQEIPDKTPDMILLADCIYYKESIGPLIQTLRDLATATTTIYLSQEMRDSDIQKENWQSFVATIKQHFHFTEVPIAEQNPQYSSPDIVLIKLTKL